MTKMLSLSTENIKRYTLEEFENIKYLNITFSLEPDVLNKIMHLTSEVGSPEYIKTPQFPKKEKYLKKRGRNFKASLSEEDWKQIRDFKATVIKKNEGIDATIDKIRQHLNKISAKTYDILSVKIFQEIDSIVNSDKDASDVIQQNLKKINNVIFDIASSNAFYSELYAKFYKNLLEKNPDLINILTHNFDKCLQLFENIENVDPAKDYNKFCEVNKVNEKRRAIIKFYINLMKLDVISTQDIYKIIHKIKTKIEEHIENKNSILTVDELAELFKIIIIEGHVCLTTSDDWKEIKQYICTMSNTSASSKEGLSNKTVFKYMDIQDALNK